MAMSAPYWSGGASDSALPWHGLAATGVARAVDEADAPPPDPDVDPEADDWCLTRCLCSMTCARNVTDFLALRSLSDRDMAAEMGNCYLKKKKTINNYITNCFSTK